MQDLADLIAKHVGVYGNEHGITVLAVLVRPEQVEGAKTKVLYSHHGRGESMLALGHAYAEILGSGPDADKIVETFKRLDPSAQSLNL